MEEFYCPACKKKLDRYEGCGSVGYFCSTCKKLVSRSKMLRADECQESTDSVQNEHSEDRFPIT